jgi:hypothetical protein
MAERHDDPTQRVFGGMLVAFALLSTPGAAHHPTDGGGSDLAGRVEELARHAGLISDVHAFILAAFVLGFAGLCGFTRQLGLGRPLALCGLVAMALGTAAMISVGAINGFALPGFAAAYAGMKPEQVEAVRATLRISWQMNQAFADIGAVLWLAALLLWSIELAMRGGIVRVVGVAGGMGAAAILAALLAGAIALTVGGVMLVTAVLALWAAAVGLLILNRRLPAL